MAYEAPKITEAGRFADITLGQLAPGPERDNNVWWDWFGDPAAGSR